MSQEIVPYVTAAAAVYGGAVAQKASDAGADATVSLGRRILHRLFQSGRAEQVRAAVADVADQPGDEDSIAVLQAQLRKALAQDPELAQELSTMVRGAGGTHYHVSHSQGVQLGSGNTQTNTFTTPPA